MSVARRYPRYRRPIRVEQGAAPKSPSLVNDRSESDRVCCRQLHGSAQRVTLIRKSGPQTVLFGDDGKGIRPLDSNAGIVWAQTTFGWARVAVADLIGDLCRIDQREVRVATSCGHIQSASIGSSQLGAKPPSERWRFWTEVNHNVEHGPSGTANEFCLSMRWPLEVDAAAGPGEFVERDVLLYHLMLDPSRSEFICAIRPREEAALVGTWFEVDDERSGDGCLKESHPSPPAEMSLLLVPKIDGE
jgi:hypothetical protein